MTSGGTFPHAKLVDALERAASDGVTDTHALRQLSRWVIGK